MAFELRNGQGTIFKNRYKETDRHPDYRGTVKTPDGELLEIALWIKEGKNGKFFSASVQEPRPQDGKAPAAASGAAGDGMPDDYDDDIPF